MSGLIVPVCKKCGRKKSYAIKRFADMKEADRQGFCLCVYMEEGLSEQK